MRVVVTGAAGFIGSHLCERLLLEGIDVLGIDAFTDYYARDEKERNLAGPAGSPRFTFVEADLREVEIEPLLTGADAVVHLAAQPGVRASWGATFAQYVEHNLHATQRLLEAMVATETQRLVFASSSSIYGSAEALPTDEDVRPFPISPYGVTKLAGEALVNAYGAEHGLSVASMRYFTVYGPRQRPDMAIRRFIAAALTGESVGLLGDGTQVRDFTFVDDAVTATAALAMNDATGPFNIGGGNPISINDLLETIEHVVGRPVPILALPATAGDVRGTAACVTRAAQAFGYQARTSLLDGIAAEAEWVERVVTRGRSTEARVEMATVEIGESR